MTPRQLSFIMAGLCLVAMPYLFFSFKKLWNVPNTEEHQDERKKIVRRLVIIVAVLGTLAFLMPLLMKFNQEYQQP